MSSDGSKPDPAVDLKLVTAASESDSDSESETPSPMPEQAPTHPRRERRSLPVWLFVVALILFALVIGRQAQVAGELEAEVAGLEERLERTHALLDAHRSHLSEIRGGVQELSERLEGLRSLVDRDPTEGIPKSAASTP